MSPTYSDPKHPEHLSWLIARRKRFVSIIREGKRACRLEAEEREAVAEVAKRIERRTKEMERKKP